MHDAMIVVAICNENVTVRGDENIAWTIERVLGGIVTLDSLGPEGHQLFSVHAVLVDHLAVSVGDPDKTKPVNIDAMRVCEQVVTPSVLELSFTIEDQNLRTGSTEYQDGSLAVCSNGYGVSVCSSRVDIGRRTKWS